MARVRRWSAVPDAASDITGPILAEGRTCWRLARADGLSFLVDAADYFALARRAILAAREQVLIVGWDLDSRVVLDPHAPPGTPRSLREILIAAVERRPGLRIHVLLWDYSIVFALEREALISLALDQGTPPAVSFAFDAEVPPTSSQHQKILVVDDGLAFTGSTDLTDHRWDTPAHDPDEPLRRRVNGTPYPPYHEVQAMVSGEAAAALGALARARWRAATGEDLTPPAPRRPRWPRDVAPDLAAVEIGIARTLPPWKGRPEVREVERLHLDAIAAARRHVYIENQYLSSDLIAGALAARLAEAEGPEVVIVAPAACTGWLEKQTMDVARGRFLARLREGDRHGRLRVFHPVVGGDHAVPVMVHAKVLVVDDRLARIGSSNLSNRSMGFDSECDLAIEAPPGPAGRPVAAAIAGLRHRLVAEHLGVPVAAFRAEEEARGSLVAAVDALNGGARRLVPLEVDASPTPLGEAAAKVADPECASRAGLSEGFAHLLERTVPREVAVGGRRLGRRDIVTVLVLAVLAAGLGGLWEWTPLADGLGPRDVAATLASAGGRAWAAPALFGAFVVGSLVFFPVTVLILAAALLLPTGEALIVSSAGSMAGAGAGYCLGRMIGGRTLRRLLGRRAREATRRLLARGIVPMLTLRILPLAPFTLVNLLAGAFRVRMRDYLVGTALGMAPGILAAGVLGRSAAGLWEAPGIGGWLTTGALLVVWLGLGRAMQWLLDRRPRLSRALRARQAGRRAA